MTLAKGLAKELKIEPEFKPVMDIKCVKYQFNEIAIASNDPVECPQNRLQVDSFNPLLDAVLVSMRDG